jgi:transmembrane sensor
MEIEDKELLKKFLNSNCTAEEARKVKELLKESDAQQIMAELTLQEWEEPVVQDKEMDAVVNGWKEKINSRIAIEYADNKKIATENITVKKLQFLRYAAIWAVLILAGIFTMLKFNNTAQTESIALVNIQGKPQRYILPDGSEIYLGAGSQLRYPAHFSGKNREVDLQGEAFFQIKHNPLRPFIVHTAEINTQVLGTSFKIVAFDNQPILVAVATGKVGVTKHTDQETKTLALLTPGMKVTWNKTTQRAEKGVIDPNGLEKWKIGEMVFEDQSMEQIAAELQRHFQVKIEFVNREIADNQVTGTFTATKSIAKIMKTLALAGKFRYETTNNKLFKIYKIN